MVFPAAGNIDGAVYLFQQKKFCCLVVKNYFGQGENRKSALVFCMFRGLTV